MARRAVINGARAPLRLENYDLPPVPPNLVRIKVAYAGVCHTDLHLRNDDGISFGTKLRDAFGEEGFKKIVMGHEIAGYVDEIGTESNADQLGHKEGDRVAVYPWLGCQKCGACRINKPNLCPRDELLLYCLGTSPQVTGGYGTHVFVDPKFLVRVPENVPLNMACLLTCSGGTVLSAMKKLKGTIEFGAASSQTGKARLVIQGAGGLGLWSVKFAKAMYKDEVHVMVAEIDPKKIDLAKEYGADEGILWSRNNTKEENIAMVIKDGKVHAVADFIGNPQTVATGASCLLRNGALVVIGLQGGDFSIAVAHLVLSGITVYGNMVFNLTEMQEVMDLVSKNSITYPDIRHFTLDAVNEALGLLEKGQITGRAVLKME